MLEHMVGRLGQSLDPVVVVAAPEQQLPTLPTDILVVRDIHTDSGPLAGIHTGLVAMAPHADIAYVTACDAPFLQTALVNEMVNRLGSADLAIPRGRRLPSPVGGGLPHITFSGHRRTAAIRSTPAPVTFRTGLRQRGRGRQPSQRPRRIR